MNKKLYLFLLGTKVQSLVASLYNFGFFIIFYQLTNSLIYSSTLTALNIIISRITLIIIVPHLKGRNPIKISIVMNMLIGFFSLICILLYKLLSNGIYGYFIISIVFSVLEEIDNSFQYSVIPNIVEKEYLFKANSLSAILSNINLIAAPLGSYIFYIYSDLRGFLFIYGLVCSVSCILLKMIEFPNSEYKKNIIDKGKKNTFFSEWFNTFNVIAKSKNILFCILLGATINLIFAGLNGAVILSMGSIAKNEVFGQTIIKLVLSIGSLIGVFFVYKLKVKENYDKYLKISIVVLSLVLLFLAFTNNTIIIYLEFLVLAIFIMFIMNSTGTFLQICAPKEELSSIYVFRSTLYAVVVPISHLITGIILEYFSRECYFIFSFILVVSISSLKFITKGDKNLEITN